MTCLVAPSPGAVLPAPTSPAMHSSDLKASCTNKTLVSGSIIYEVKELSDLSARLQPLGIGNALLFLVFI